MVAVNALSIILLHVPLMVKLNLGEPVSGFFKRNYIFDILVFSFYTFMAILAFNRATLLFMTVLAEIVEDNHL